MNKSAAFRAGVRASLEKRALFGFGKRKATRVVGETAGKALGLGVQKRGVVTTATQMNPKRHLAGQKWTTKKVQPLEVKGLTDQPTIRWT